MPGTASSASGTVRRCWVSRSCAVITVTELATCSPGVATDVGLTTMLGPLRAEEEPATDGAGGLGVGRGVVTAMPGSSIGGETEICADALDSVTALKTDPARIVAMEGQASVQRIVDRSRERILKGIGASG